MPAFFSEIFSHKASSSLGVVNMHLISWFARRIVRACWMQWSL